MVVNIADLLPSPIKVLVVDDKYLELQPLSLEAMVTLLVDNQELFLTLYSQAETGTTASEKIGAVLLSAPEFVSKIIAIAAGAVGQEAHIRKLPPTVQLIALHELWKASVPDPKKAGELLSVVMAQLRGLSQKGKASPRNNNSAIPQPTLATDSQPLSNPS